MAQFLITVPAFLVTEINLGLLGLGTAEPLPSWGAMLRDLEGYGAWTGSRVQLVPLVTLVAVTVSLQLFLTSEERC
jgi:ABC-type dipeptide/oligopeptide/nickel transport system permease subunit